MIRVFFLTVVVVLSGCKNSHTYDFENGKDLPSYTLKNDSEIAQIREFAYLTKDGSRCFLVFQGSMTGAGCWDQGN